MANYQYTSDLIDDVLFRGGEPTDGTSDFEAAALRYINRAYKAVWTGGAELLPGTNEIWWWLRSTSPGVLTLEPYITTGTVSVTNNSTSATLSASQATDVANWFFVVDGHADVFRIATHGGSTDALVLDSAYTGTTNATATYKLFKLVYSLDATVLQVLGPMRAYQDGVIQVQGVSVEQMDRQWPLYSINSGVPRAFAPISETTVRFSHYGGTSSTDYIRLDYEYFVRPADLTDSSTEEPSIPQHYRYIVADYALALIYRDKGDPREMKMLASAKEGIRAMVNENRHRWGQISDYFAVIQPRQRNLDQFRGPVRTSSGLILS